MKWDEMRIHVSSCWVFGFAQLPYWDYCRYTRLIRPCIPLQGIASLHWVCQGVPNAPARWYTNSRRTIETHVLHAWRCTDVSDANWVEHARLLWCFSIHSQVRRFTTTLRDFARCLTVQWASSCQLSRTCSPNWTNQQNIPFDSGVGTHTWKHPPKGEDDMRWNEVM